MLEKIAIIFLALALLMVYWFCKNLDNSVDNLRDAYIRLSRAYEEQEKRMEKLQAAVRDKRMEKLQAAVGDILKDVNS